MTLFRKSIQQRLCRCVLPFLLLFVPVAAEAATVTATYLGQLDALSVRRTINGTVASILDLIGRNGTPDLELIFGMPYFCSPERLEAQRKCGGK